MRDRLRQILEQLSIPILAVVLGLLVSCLFVWIGQADPIAAYQSLFCEGFGSKGCENFGDLFMVTVTNEDSGETGTFFAPFYGENGHRLAQVLERATPLIFTALSATVAFKAGMFSIGMDGQFILGGITAVFLGYWIPDQIYASMGIAEYDAAPQTLLTVMHVIIPLICIAAAMAVGAFYSWIAGILKVKLNVNELISTIILNAIAVQLVGYIVNFPMRADMNNIARTRPIDDSAWLVPFSRGLFADVDWFSNSRMGIGLFIAIGAAIVVWFFLFRTTAGYEQRMTSGSKLFARFGGIPSERAVLRAMLISGALSGLGGAIQILGVERRVVDGWTLSGSGFDGVLVAILAKEAIPAILVVAILFSGLDLGAINLQFGNLTRQLGGIIISFIILFSSMETFFRQIIARIQTRLRPPRSAAGEAQAGAST